MNPVALGLDALLAALLVAALAVGLRLNAKLKVLRTSQADFAKAVAALDIAAGRAEQGLAALRLATQEAHDQLLDRIETARALSARLDRASEDAGAAAGRMEAAVHGAQVAARRADESAARLASAPLAAIRLPAEAPREPIPFPSIRPSPEPQAPPAGLRAALAAAERIVAAEIPPSPAAASDAAIHSDDRLARFVARRRGARA